MASGASSAQLLHLTNQPGGGRNRHDAGPRQRTNGDRLSAWSHRAVGAHRSHCRFCGSKRSASSWGLAMQRKSQPGACSWRRRDSLTHSTTSSKAADQCNSCLRVEQCPQDRQSGTGISAPHRGVWFVGGQPDATCTPSLRALEREREREAGFTAKKEIPAVSAPRVPCEPCGKHALSHTRPSSFVPCRRPKRRETQDELPAVP